MNRVIGVKPLWRLEPELSRTGREVITRPVGYF